jgi:trans-2,3-dihydro-3-hydroxyanthranilate isomerase
MAWVDARLYAAFAAAPFGGNVAGVVYDSAGLDSALMQRLAAELGAPTTGFVRDLGTEGFGVRFFSRTAEMPMCGHATIGVFAALADDGRVQAGAHRMHTGAGELIVAVGRGPSGVRITMRQPSPRFDLFDVPAGRIGPLLGLAAGDVKGLGSAATGLRHLLVEVAGTDALARLRVDDDAVRDLSRDAGIDTIGVYARLEGRGDHRADVRVRDLCHGVGDPEEAASGTTNAALAALLWREGRLAHAKRLGDALVIVRAEQGFEMGRPSLVETELHLSGQRIESVRVGGTATRRLEGRLFLE